MNTWVRIINILKIVKWPVIRYVCGNGGLLRFTIGNTRYLGSSRGPDGPNGLEPPPLLFNG